jgi:ribosomal protein S18 acetylase RimI-like enzyme
MQLSQETKVIFRHATREDQEALVDLKLTINLAEYAVYPTTSAIPRFLDLSREAAAAGIDDYWACIAAQGGTFLVGELNGVIVCCGCWYGETAAVSTLPHCRRQAGIGGIVVSDRARGQGLGRRLMQELEALVRAQGIKHIRLTVVPSNVPAENLYDSLGFEAFETVMIKTLT